MEQAVWIMKNLAMKLNNDVLNNGKSEILFNEYFMTWHIMSLKGFFNGTEETQILCTTHNNIKSWFDNWQSNLVELKFAENHFKGELKISTTN